MVIYKMRMRTRFERSSEVIFGCEIRAFVSDDIYEWVSEIETNFIHKM